MLIGLVYFSNCKRGYISASQPLDSIHFQTTNDRLLMFLCASLSAVATFSLTWLANLSVFFRPLFGNWVMGMALGKTSDSVNLYTLCAKGDFFLGWLTSVSQRRNIKGTKVFSPLPGNKGEPCTREMAHQVREFFHKSHDYREGRGIKSIFSQRGSPIANKSLAAGSHLFSYQMHNAPDCFSPATGAGRCQGETWSLVLWS